MKRFVDLIQFLIIAVILSPVYFFWQSEKVEQFCNGLETTMSLTVIQQLAEEHGFEVVGLEAANVDFGKWQASIESKWPLVSDYCLIKGLGDTVGKIKYIDE
jgi:hypothetical protein